MAAFVVLGLAPLAVLGYSGLSLANHAVRTEVEARVRSVAATSGVYTADMLASMSSTLAAYADRAQLAAAIGADGHPDQAALTGQLAELQRARPDAIGAFVADPTGRVLAVLPVTPGVNGQDFSSRDWFRGVRQTDRPYVSEAYQTAILDHPRVVAVATRVHAPGRVGQAATVGVLGVIYGLDALAGLTRTIARTQGIRLSLTDQRGSVIAAPGIGRTELVSRADDPLVRSSLRGGRAMRTSQDGPAGVLSAYAPIAGLGWTVTAEIPAATAFAGAHRLTSTIYAIVAVLGAVLAALFAAAGTLEGRRRRDERALARQATALADSEGRYRTAVDALEEAVVVVNGAGEVLTFNASAARMYGMQPADTGVSVTDPSWRRLAQDGSACDSEDGPVLAALRTGRPSSGVVMGVQRAGGDLRWVSINTRPLFRPGQPAPYAVVSSGTDITAQREADAALRVSERRFRTAFTHAPVGMARVGPHGELLEANHALHEMLGAAPDSVVGRRVTEFTHPHDLALTAERMSALERGEIETLQSEQRLLHADGHWVWALVSSTRQPAPTGEQYTLSLVLDISDRKADEARLSKQALHDPLTGLANRLLLEQRVDHAIARAARDPRGAAVLFVDLDGFKAVNDTLGHQTGDAVLVEVAARIKAALRPTDMVARLGGDEFVVLCEDLATSPTEVASGLADRLIRLLERPLHHGGHRLSLSASIGVAMVAEGSRTADLLAEADAAMYRAKQEGKAGHRVFDESMRGVAATPSHTLRLVGDAVVEDRLRLHYQPVVDIANDQVVGAEALLRMVGEGGQLLAPAEFLPAAEAHGHIVGFGAWTLRAACRQAVEWKATLALDRPFSIGVNLSVKEIQDSGAVDRVRRALEDSGLPPTALVIELTESTFLRDVPLASAALGALRELGVKIALDDFGTGYSSLSYLRRVPVDIIKIDRSFVADLLNGEASSKVTGAIIELAHNIGAVVVAEGVEEPAQLHALAAYGCRLAQGYLLSRPTPPADFADLLDRQLVGAALLPRRVPA